MIEKLMEFISPDCCLECGIEGSCLCVDCESICLVPKKQACAICNKLDTNGRTCARCYSKSKLSGSTIAYRYDGTIKQLVAGMKFENKRSYARFLARQLPFIESDMVCYVPSDGKTRRSRGYDQAEILAKTYAINNSLQLKRALIRKRHVRQVGLNRNQRIENIKNDFIVNVDVKGKSIVIIDDVITTGATISECSRLLKAAGAKRVWAVAVAKG